ncbi:MULTISPECIES: CBS domain-containing protein [Olivibacter]|jgi:CBS domain-containing protein|uniref:CBS domain-containing protein n=2 Tax=Sphingobacteriaceae TaxID=84566 RepID=A0ABV6HN95_9SPHI|nr:MULTISPECIES: CBS domain-containing protein [Olivibacter]MCL4641544.1 CBS domain-containing protein [Olivibacter sp. UJ_SKK_5.1]MDM8173330.1 CBS domain-containing protein [Olivibacter sp. 47]MDX3915233.1 CBS domain-containing protein [Pseudosphingobacterium sp.]QEL03105.1 CBS domain-containing protein [Olivibacter sp. LS-1]
MKTVKYILENKAKSIVSVSPNDSVLGALRIMMEKNISALLVVDQGVLLGIFTERDYARKIILKGRASANTAIHEVMTSNPHTVGPNHSIDHCMQLMTDRHFRHLPIVENGNLIGIISIGDLVKYIIEDQKQTISHLESYINS